MGSSHDCVATSSCYYLPLIDPKDLAELIEFVIRAHDEHAREPRKRFRKWDTGTPYAIHPIWCAMTLLTETSLPQTVRKDGARALLLHDILEDTTAELPERVYVHNLVAEMTFESFEEEHELVWQRSELCILLKLYDKVSNLMDMNWRTGKHDLYIQYTRRLCEVVKARWGILNIVRIAEAIAV